MKRTRWENAKGELKERWARQKNEGDVRRDKRKNKNWFIHLRRRERQISTDRVTRTVKRKDGEYKRRGKRGTKRKREREGLQCNECEEKEDSQSACEREKCVCEGHTVASRSKDSRCPAARLLASCRKKSPPTHPLCACPFFASRVPPLLPHSNVDLHRVIALKKNVRLLYSFFLIQDLCFLLRASVNERTI